MAGTLQDLRKEAGFKTAREFAEALGIPAPTYARYEQTPDKIPLKAAWHIADRLGCSIDMLVGRVQVDTSALKGEVQRFYESLSPESQDLFNEFRSFIAYRDKQVTRRHKMEEERKYNQLARQYEDLFVREMDARSDFGEVVIFSTPDQERAEFERFVRKNAAEKREREVEEACRRTRALPPSGDGHAPTKAERLVRERAEAFRKKKAEELERRDEEVIAKIMRAYDRMKERRRYFTERDSRMTP